MSEMPDAELLQQFVQNHSEAAFADLVERHIGLVYSTALRKTDNPQHAQDVTQAVFIILASKAASLGPKTVLPGWLYHTARLTAANLQRAERRRFRREQEAFMQSIINESAADALWRELSPLLEDGMARLGANDRDAIVLRFFQNRSLAEVGTALGASEDAARMRVNRALECLRKFFNKRGVTSTTAVIAGVISSNSIQAAPAGLANSISAVALAKGTAASASTLTLVKGALKFMAWTNTKTAVVACIGLLVMAGTATVAVKGIDGFQTPAWQKRYDLSYLDSLPPQVKILPSLPSTLRSGIHASGMRNGKGLALGQSIPDIVMAAYHIEPAQLIWKAPVPGVGRYDVLANLPGGDRPNFLAVQKAVRKTFGVAARNETVTTNALILAVKFRNAPGFRAADPGKFSGDEEINSYSAHGQSISGLVEYLESRLGIVVIDRTQLDGIYNIDFQWDGQTRNGLEKALLDQVGLELIPTNQPIQMFVVEKTK